MLLKEVATPSTKKISGMMKDIIITAFEKEGGRYIPDSEETLVAPDNFGQHDRVEKRVYSFGFSMEEDGMDLGSLYAGDGEQSDAIKQKIKKIKDRKEAKGTVQQRTALAVLKTMATNPHGWKFLGYCVDFVPPRLSKLDQIEGKTFKDMPTEGSVLMFFDNSDGSFGKKQFDDYDDDYIDDD